MTPEYRNCPVCSGDDAGAIRKLSYALFDDSPLESSSCTLVRCNKCGFVYCDTVLNDANLIEHYRRNLHYLSGTCGAGSNAETMRYRNTLSMLKLYNINQSSKIVDIGSANGGFLRFMKNNGYMNLMAIDPLQECIDNIHESRIPAKRGSIQSMPLPDASEDAVVVSHLLEHVIDLNTALGEVYRILVPGGIVYAEVPTLEYGSSFQDAPLWDFPYEHVNYFTRRHLLSLFMLNRFSCLHYEVSSISRERGNVKCVHAIFKKNIQRDTLDSRFSSLDSTTHHGIKKLASDHIPCYVWGVSAYTQMLLAMTPLGECNIRFFLDKSKYKQGKTINGIQIKSPEVLKVLPDNVVVIFTKEPYGDEMNRYLDEIKHIGKRIEI